MSNILVQAVDNAGRDYPYPFGSLANGHPNTYVIEVFPALTVEVTRTAFNVVRDVTPPSLWSYADEILEHNLIELEKCERVIRSFGLEAVYVQFLDYMYTNYPYNINFKAILLEVKIHNAYTGDRGFNAIREELEYPELQKLTIKTTRSYARLVRGSRSWYKYSDPYGLYFRPRGTLSRDESEYVALYRNRMVGSKVQRLVLGG